MGWGHLIWNRLCNDRQKYRVFWWSLSMERECWIITIWPLDFRLSISQVPRGTYKLPLELRFSCEEVPSLLPSFLCLLRHFCPFWFMTCGVARHVYNWKTFGQIPIDFLGTHLAVISIQHLALSGVAVYYSNDGCKRGYMMTEWYLLTPLTIIFALVEVSC